MSDSFRSGFVTIIGRPNAGKSTLLNKIIGEKIAITSDKPQTTRNRITGILTEKDWQIVFVDTPGIHKPHDTLGDNMIRSAMNAMEEVDVIYYLIDATVPFGKGDAFILEKLATVKTPKFLLLNKIDLLEKTKLLPLIYFYRSKLEWKEIIPISALSGDNVRELVEITLPYLSPGPRYYPEEAFTDQSERNLVTELIREKVLELTRDEVPHSVAVNVEQMEERTDALTYIHATIYVERDSQKAIIIGKKGGMLKEIGYQARLDIETLLGTKVFLELFVKVKTDWRNKEKFLQEMGYEGN